MSEQKEYFKTLAKIESHIVLTRDGLYDRQQWPEVVEWWLLHGDFYNSAKRVDAETAERLERMFRGRE